MNTDSTSHVAALIEDLDPGAMVTQFVVVAEVIDTDGERGVWTQTHDGASQWDTYGLLTWALAHEKAKHHASVLCDDDDEDTV